MQFKCLCCEKSFPFYIMMWSWDYVLSGTEECCGGQVKIKSKMHFHTYGCFGPGTYRYINWHHGTWAGSEAAGSKLKFHHEYWCRQEAHTVGTVASWTPEEDQRRPGAALLLLTPRGDFPEAPSSPTQLWSPLGVICVCVCVCARLTESKRKGSS